MDRQARFLNRSATSKLSLATHSNLTVAQMTNLLRSTSRTYPSTNQTVTPLFHAVSPMIRSKGCIIRYLPQHRSAVLETMVQLQTFLPGFQGPSESPSISATSCQRAGLEDPSLRDIAKQTASKATAQDSSGTGGRMQITMEPGRPPNTSSVHKKAVNALPQFAPGCTRNLLQEIIRILDQLFHSQLPRLDLDLSITTVPPSANSKLPCPQKGPMLLRWLMAILQLLQNTAWDQWSYRNGLI